MGFGQKGLIRKDGSANLSLIWLLNGMHAEASAIQTLLFFTTNTDSRPNVYGTDTFGLSSTAERHSRGKVEWVMAEAREAEILV